MCQNLGEADIRQKTKAISNFLRVMPTASSPELASKKIQTSPQKTRRETQTVGTSASVNPLPSTVIPSNSKEIVHDPLNKNEMTTTKMIMMIIIL